MRQLLLWCCLLPAASELAIAQTATLRGTVTDASGLAVSGARVELANQVTGFAKSSASGPDGGYTFTNIPFQTYSLTVEASGFTPQRQTLSLRSPVVENVDLVLSVAAKGEQLSVSGFDRSLLVNPEETGTRAQMDHKDIEKMALQVGNRGLEAVLVTFPGFQQNANGAIHPRGAHNQMTYVIDGMPVSDQLTGAFGNAVDPGIVDSVELFTGNIPAEYGNKVAAVVNVITRSGVGSARRFAGSVAVSAAGFGTLSQVTQVVGEAHKVGYSASVNTIRTDRYLDPVSFDNLHNGGHSTRGFLRLDYGPRPRDLFHLDVLAGSSPFELANLRSQQENGMAQRQLMRDASLAVGWVHTLDSRSTYEANISFRSASAQLFSSAGDTPVAASQARRLGTFTSANRYNRLRGRHNLQIGVDFQRFAARENFDFSITAATFNTPGAPDFNPALLPFDRTRGGGTFRFGETGAGRLYSGYARDNVNLGPLQLSLGLRYDRYRYLSRGAQWQPRVGAAYHIKRSGSVLRVSYNRLYQTPVNENLLLSSSPHAAVLTPPAVRAALGGAFVLIRPERQNLYEAGVQQELPGRVGLGVVFYHKQAWDQADNNNFFNTGIIFPIALASIRVNSVEARLVVPARHGVSATLSLTHSRAISTPPFTGGLFLGNDAVQALSQRPFVIDHDQPLAIHGTLTYASKRGFYSTLSTRYDSGLVINPSDPQQVQRDPDYADLLPYINLASSPPRARARTVSDLVLGYERAREARRRYDVSFQISNVFDKRAVYNFQSLFVGTRTVQPRTAGVRVRYHF